MPIYEYGCYDCHKRVNIFFRSFAEAATKQAACPRCKFEAMVSILRSERVTSEPGRPISLAGLDENDPKSMAAGCAR